MKSESLKESFGKTVLPLSILENEYFIGRSPLEILLFYRKKTPISIFKKSIFKTIEHYNLFSSRLIMIERDRFALLYCRDGFVPKVLPAMDVSFDDMDIEEIKKMMVHIKTLPGEPLFAVTGIPIKDGVLAGISWSHAVADGISILLFLHAWMCITEGKSFPRPSPQRLFKGDPVHFNKIYRGFAPPLSQLNDVIQNRVRNMEKLKVYTKNEYFSDEFLAQIRNEMKLKSDQDAVSHNQIITSFLLKKYHRSILPNTELIRLKTPVNLRNVHPEVDALYIGNAVFHSLTEFTKDEIDKMSIPQIARRIRESVVKTKNENYFKEIAYLSDYGIEFKKDRYEKYRFPADVNTDIFSADLTYLNVLESLGMGSDIVRILHIGLTVQTGFTLFREKGGRIFAQITSRHPFT